MTKEIPTAGGVPITDDLVDRLAAEAEEGYDVPTPPSPRWSSPSGLGAGAAAAGDRRDGS